MPSSDDRFIKKIGDESSEPECRFAAPTELEIPSCSVGQTKCGLSPGFLQGFITCTDSGAFVSLQHVVMFRV